MTEIRLQILKGEGLGLNKTENVRVIAEKIGCSRQDVYYHYGIRDKWQGDFLDFKNAGELKQIIVSRLNHVYRESSFQYLHADNSNAKVGALRLMLDATMSFAEFLPKGATITKTPNEVKLSWQGEPTAELLKQYDELIKISREEDNSFPNDLAVYSEEQKQVLDHAYQIIRSKNPIEPVESLH